MSLLLKALPLALLAICTCANADASKWEADPVISRFREYLRIRTDQPHPDYASAAAFLERQGAEIGLHVRTLTFEAEKPVVLLTWNGTDPSLPSILLNSHTDVVPAERQFWSRDPFGAEMDSTGDIFARGSQDMKCVGMQYLEAIRLLKGVPEAGATPNGESAAAETPFRPLRSLHAVFVPDEEIGGKAGMHAFVTSGAFRELNVGLELDEGWATPGEAFPVFYAERIAWWLVIRAEGEPGHGSKLYDGGAMENLQGALARVFEYRAREFDKMKRGAAAAGDVVSVNLVSLKGGVPSELSASFNDAKFVMNMQPAVAEAGFDVRVPPTVDLGELERTIREEWAPPSLNLSVSFFLKSEIKLRPDGTPGVTSLDAAANPWWGAFTASIARQGLPPPEPEIFPAATDASYLRARDVPSLGFSPMRRTPKLLHEHDERLNAKVFLEGVAVYQELLRDLASMPPPQAPGQAAAGAGSGQHSEL